MNLSSNFIEYSKGLLIILETFPLRLGIKKMLETKTSSKALTINLTILGACMLIPPIRLFNSLKLIEVTITTKIITTQA
jgi:hypothetical protein